MNKKIIPALILSLFTDTQALANNAITIEDGHSLFGELSGNYTLNNDPSGNLFDLSGNLLLDISGNPLYQDFTLYYTDQPQDLNHASFINLLNLTQVNAIDFYTNPIAFVSGTPLEISGYIQNGNAGYVADSSGNYYYADVSGNFLYYDPSGNGFPTIINPISLEGLGSLSNGIKNYGFIGGILGGANDSTLNINNYQSGTISWINISGGGTLIGSIVNNGVISDGQDGIYIAGTTLDGSITNTGYIRNILNHGLGIISGSITNSGSIDLLQNIQASQINGSIINEVSGSITTLDLGGGLNGNTEGTVQGNILNSGTISTLNAKGLQGSIQNSGTIDTLYLEDKTLYLTGNAVVNVLYATEANVSIGYDSSNTHSFSASNLDLFSANSNTYNAFTIQQNSSLNLTYDPSGNNVGYLDAIDFYNNGTISLGSGNSLILCQPSNCESGNGPYTFHHSGTLEFEINGNQAPYMGIDGNMFADAGAKIAIKSGSIIDPNYLRFGVIEISGEYSGTLPTAAQTSFSSNGSRYQYYLEENGQYLDLVFALLTGPTAADTQASLNTQARRLRSTFNSTMASTNFANMNAYDCNLFDKNNMCISAGGRYTNIDNPSSNNSAAVVVLGYKVNSNIRIGGFLDQSINNNMPTGINISNKNPMMGAFAVWNKNPDGLGYQVKIANAYQDKDVTSTRDAFGETGEAGTGKTNLNTQSYVGELSYAFNYQDSTIVRPYFALRYTNIKQDAYTETGVDNPLSYAKLGDRSMTALTGVKLNHALTPRTNLTASLGLEQDLHQRTDQLTASAADISGLTSENFNNNIKRTRPVASAGAYYAVAKNQRLSGEVYYQQLPFQSTGSTTAYFNYMIGF
jgi:hypothetical protein